MTVDAVIRVSEVTRSFPGPPEVRALRAIDLVIARGEYVSMVGPSGSGKSTLLNLLGLLDSPSVGEYALDGVETTTLGPAARATLRAQTIGFVFQAFHLLPDRSVLENVMMSMLYNGSPRAQREERAREAVDRVGLSHRTGFSPVTLSGGERQRVAVARAVAARPVVLLADEPTGNLDDATSEEVMDLFAELHRDGLTLVVITHDQHVAGRADRTIRLNDGRIEDAS